MFDDAKEEVREFAKDYKVNQCEPNWFEDKSCLESEKKQQNLKYIADHAFLEKEWSAALEAYKQCLDLIAKTNMSMQRDLQSGIILCHFGLNEYDTALQLAQNLYAAAINHEHRTNSLHLLIKIQEQMKCWADMAVSVERLLVLHPQNSKSWRQLAKAYQELSKPVLDVKLAEMDLNKESEQSHNFSELTVKCLLRAKFLNWISSYHLPAPYMKEQCKKEASKMTDELIELGVTLDEQDSCIKSMRDEFDSEDDEKSNRSTASPEKVLAESDSYIRQYILEKWIYL